MARTRTHPLSVAAEWRATRRLYPIYAAIAREFQLGDPPCKDLNEVNDQSEPDVVQRIGQWLAEMDECIQAHHFRQLLQTSDLASSEDKMHTLVDRYLNKEHRTESDRDKIDFLLIQYFAVCAPPSFHDREVDLDDVAEVLEPIFGECPTFLPEWLRPLEQLIADMQRCGTLADLERHRIIERGRELKAASGERYFGSSALLAFTRFNYLLRRTCCRLMNDDLRAIEAGLWELGARGVYFVDCTSVQLSPQEPISNLFQVCLNWKKPPISDYSTGHSFDLLMGLRTTIERALAPEAPADGTGEAAASDVQRRLDRIEGEMVGLRALLEEVLARVKAGPAASSKPASPQAAAPRDSREKPRVSVAPASPATVSPATVSPAATPSAAPPTAPSPQPSDLAKVPPSPPLTVSVGVEHIRKLLLASSSKRPSSVNIAIGTTAKLLLTAAEVSAFLKGSDEVAVALQRAVAARFLLVGILEKSKSTGEKPDLKPLLQSARDESDNLRRHIAQAEKVRNTSLAEILTFANRQLLAIIIHVEGRVGGHSTTTQNR